MAGVVETSIYRLETVLEANDKATARLNDYTKAVDNAARSTTTLSTTLKAAAATAAGYGLFAKGKSMLIDFNAGVEETKNQIAGMLALATKTDLTDNLKRADHLYSSLQKRAASLPGTTQEYVTMAGNLTQPIMDAGLRMKDLEDITVATVVAAKALREDSQAAARDVGQALRGQAGADDPFIGKLLDTAGFSGQDGRKRFNQKSKAERAQIVKDVVTQKQIMQLAEAQGATFSGMMSTLQDTVQQTAGKMGKPLFQAITREVKEINAWLAKNSHKIDEMATTIANGLVKGFGYVKDAVAFIAKHSDTIIAAGKAWAAVKLTGIVGGALGGSIQGLMSGGGKMGMNLGIGASGKFSAGKLAGDLAANLGSIAMLGTASYMATTQIMKAVGAFDYWSGSLDPANKEMRNSTAHLKAFANALDHAKGALDDEKGALGSQASVNLSASARLAQQQFNVLQDIKRDYGIGKDFEGQGHFKRQAAYKKLESVGLDRDLAYNAEDFNATMASARDAVGDLVNKRNLAAQHSDKLFGQVMADMPPTMRESIDQQKALQEVMRQMVAKLSQGDNASLMSYQDVWNIVKGYTDTDPGGFRAQGKPNVTNIKIDRVEVAAKDPDRWISDLDAKAKARIRAPRGARNAVRGGM